MKGNWKFMIMFLTIVKYLMFGKLYSDQLKDEDKSFKKLYSYHWPRFFIYCLLINVMIEIFVLV